MSISSIGGVGTLVSAPGAAVAGNTLASVAAGSADSALIENVDAASSGVSAALQSLSGALGSIIDVSA
jgi:hypothetical protein